MIFHSIRWRLQVWHSLILVAVLIGFGATAYRVARANQLRRIDQELQQRLMSALRPGPPPEAHFFKGPPPQNSPPDRPPSDHPSPHGFDHDPAAWRARVQEVIARAGVLEAGQTNAFYYMVWEPDGSLMAASAGAPKDAPPPLEASHERESNERSGARTRGEYRELGVCLPFGDRALVGRSMAPDLAAMHQLALWLFASAISVMTLGTTGGSGSSTNPFTSATATTGYPAKI